MARSGRFLRLPRAAPSLTATIVGLKRQAQNQRDQNIMDAWQKGGMFEGKPVTDDDVLAYWTQRAAALSETDPLYDDAKNLVSQLDYNINESKQGLLYQQGKINDRQMAQFYLDWSKKVPRDSAFWRTLQTDAARFMQNAKARGRASVARASGDSYAAAVSQEWTRNVALGETVTDLLTQVAKDNGLIDQDQDLSYFEIEGQNDPEKMDAILDQLNGAMRANPDEPWVVSVAAAIRRYDPDWNGTISAEYFAQALSAQVAGYQRMAQISTDAGKTGEANKWTKKAAEATALGTGVGSWSAGAAYGKGREAFDAVWKDPGATDADRALAAETFATFLEKTSKMPGLAPFQSNMLLNDARAMRGDPGAAGITSFSENFLGISGRDEVRENDALIKTIGEINHWSAIHEASPMQVVMAHYKLDPQGNRTFDPTGEGPVGYVPSQSVALSGVPTQTIPVVTLTGQAIMQVVNEVPIKATGPDGQEIVVGRALITKTGGLTTTLYGTLDSTVAMSWSSVSPAASDVTERRDSEGIHWVKPAPAYDASAAAENLSIRVPEMIASVAPGAPPLVAGATWSHTKGKTTTTVKWDGKKFLVSTSTDTMTRDDKKVGSTDTPFTVYDPATDPNVTGQPAPSPAQQQEAFIASLRDPSRGPAGPNQRIDFPTPMMAALVASGANGLALYNAWRSPEFQQQLQYQQLIAAGADAGNPPGADGLFGADPAKLATLRQIDASLASRLAGTGLAITEYGPNSAEAGWYRPVTAAQYASRLDAISKAMERGKDDAVVPPTIQIGRTLTTPVNPLRPTTTETEKFNSRPPAEALISPQHPALTPTPVAPIQKDDVYTPPPPPTPTVGPTPGVPFVTPVSSNYTPPAVSVPKPPSATDIRRRKTYR